MNKPITHKHLIIRAEVNKPPTDEVWVQNWFRMLVEKIGMKVCRGPITSYINVPGNRGITGVVIIETSHIALHVWDECDPGLMQFDVYTCGPFDPKQILELLQEFEPTKIEHKYLDRENGLVELTI